MSCQQQQLAVEAVEFMLKYYGWNEEDAKETVYYFNNDEQNTNDILTPPHEVYLYRSHCIDLSLNNKDNHIYFEDEEQELLTQKKQSYESIPLEQKVKDLEYALRIAKERIGDLWMELYDERRRRIELEEKLGHITIV